MYEIQIARLRPDPLRRGSLPFTLRFKRRLVEAAGVEPEVGIITIGVYANLPNVYRIIDVLILVISFISILFPAIDLSYEI